MSRAEFVDFRILEVLAAAQNPAQQNRGVDRGDFRIPKPFAGVDVGEVIEKSAMVGQGLPQEAQRVEDAGTRLVERNKTALLPNAEGREPESGGRNAGDYGVVGGCLAGVTAVLDQAG